MGRGPVLYAKGHTSAEIPLSRCWAEQISASLAFRLD